MRQTWEHRKLIKMIYFSKSSPRAMPAEDIFICSGGCKDSNTCRCDSSARLFCVLSQPQTMPKHNGQKYLQLFNLQGTKRSFS